MSTTDVSGITGRKSELINEMVSSQTINNAFSGKKISSTSSVNNIWLKQAFIRTEKFRNEFIQI